MGISELARLLLIARHQGETGYVVVVQDEDGDVYTITDAYLDAKQKVVVLRVDSRPLELRGL